MMTTYQRINNRILIVDDDPNIALAFKMGLEDAGFIVDLFNDPKVASSNFKYDLYDLLLLDIKIPKLNGIKFYRQMKYIDKKVKVCFITASEIYYYEMITKEIFPSLGVKRLFRKLIKRNDLIKSLKQELGWIDSNNNNDTSSQIPHGSKLGDNIDIHSK
jgi:two-component system response regulator ChvI